MFLIKLTFHDVEQFWGLKDVMNTSQTKVNNAVNLAFFMINFSGILLKHIRLYTKYAIGVFKNFAEIEVKCKFPEAQK